MNEERNGAGFGGEGEPLYGGEARRNDEGINDARRNGGTVRGAHASAPVPSSVSDAVSEQAAQRKAARTQGPDAMRHGMTGRHAAVHSRTVSPQAAVVSGNPRNQAQLRGRRLNGKTGRHSIEILGDSASDVFGAQAAAAAQQTDRPHTNNPRERAANQTGVRALSGNPRAAKAAGQGLPETDMSSYSAEPANLQEAGAPALGVIDAPGAGMRTSAAGMGGAPGNSADRFSSEMNMMDAKRKRSRRKKIIGTVVAVLLVVILAGGGAAFAYMMSIQSTLQEGVSEETLDVLDSSVPITDPFYMLLMGTDESKQRDESGDFGDSYRTDSMMLLRVDPKEKKVACVSIMRDLQIDLGEYGTQKINAAHAFGGTSLAIEAVSDLADVPIAHFAEIDFDGFKDVVDALGGIEVNVPIEIDDPDAGGHLNSGLQTLDGEQALILCRSRYAFEEYGSGDLYRAANQRIVIAAIVKKILSSDVPTMIDTISKLAQYVTTDLSVMDIVNLANTMRGMDLDTDFYTAVTPTESEYVDGIWWEILDDEAWETMMDRVFNGLPPVEETEIDEVTGMVFSNAGDGGAADAQIQPRKKNHEGKVSVKNGCGVTGVGAEVAEIIEALGFTAEAGNANNANYQETVVVYNTEDQEQDALDIATALGGVPTIKNDNEYIFEGDFLVVVGADWVS